MKIFLIDFLESDEYYRVTYWLKKHNINLPFIETYSPKQRRNFNKLYVRANDMVILLDTLFLNTNSNQRYDFRKTTLYKAIMRLADIFIKAGVDLKLDYEEQKPIVGDKVILSRIFSNQEVCQLNYHYLRVTGSKFPKWNNRVYYVSKKEFNEIADYKGISKVLPRMIKQLDTIFKEMG